jgi:hypothetical protein
MAHVENAFLCAVVMVALWTLVGAPIALRLAEPPTCWLWAPALGWAVYNVVVLPLVGWIGMGQATVLVVTMVFAVAGLVGCFLQGPPMPQRRSLLAIAAVVTAASLLALAPAAAVLPKETPEGVTLAASIFDHSKIAMVDEVIRSGVPLKNPFFNESGVPDGVAYYYLWHFSAAVIAVLTRVSGWEADAALTWFTAFASLLTMIGLAAKLGGKMAAGFVVIALAGAASARALLEWAGPDVTTSLIGRASGLGGWLFQMAWAPQHLASATCVVLACLLLVRLAHREDWFAPPILGLVAVAGFECSVWVGGVTFALGATMIALYLLWTLAPERRLAFALRALAAAALALAISFPFIRDQIAVATARAGGPPIAIAPVAVLGTAFPESVRRFLDVPAYWLVYLTVEFAAFYPAGLAGLFFLLKDRSLDAQSRQTIRPLALLAATSLVAAWLLRSVVADNNDLGWRAVLPGLLLLIVFAAAAISRWPLRGARLCAILAAAGVLLTLPDTLQLLHEDFYASRTPSERLFAATPSMWQAVRRHAGPSERIANNPRFLDDMTPWPANISWALMGDRRSCYAGNELAIPFAPIPAAARAATEARFVRVFAGEPAADDIRELADLYGCDVVVVTAEDGAWRRDPFASSELYHLVEMQPDRWRIYRRTNPQMPANQLKPRSSQ